ncbi:MAG: phosphatase PAP2 family protein [bacterium]
MKKSIFALILIFLSVSIAAENTILNRVFFLDFQYVGQAIGVDPVKTGLLVGAFGLTTYALMKNDLWFSQTIRSIQNDFNDTFFNVLTNAGDPVYVLPADALLFFVGGEKEKKTAIKVVEGLAVSGLISYVGKVVFGRHRPSRTDNPGAFNWFNFANNSYPSGHTTVAFTWATIIGDAYNIGWITYPIATLTGIARVYNKEHWLSDALFGACIGVITGKIVNYEGPDLKISALPGGLEASYQF